MITVWRFVKRQALEVVGGKVRSGGQSHTGAVGKATVLAMMADNRHACTYLLHRSAFYELLFETALSFRETSIYLLLKEMSPPHHPEYSKET